MIRESFFWKRDLVRFASRLMKLDAVSDWTDEQYARVEKDVMVGAFICRKLGESHKFTGAHWGQRMDVTTYPLKREPPTLMQNHRPEDFYDLQNGRSEAIALKAICDQVIHSHIFVLAFDEDRGQHVLFFASDRGRRQRLIQLDLSRLARMFLVGGKDYPHKTEMHRVSDKDDFEVNSW